MAQVEEETRSRGAIVIKPGGRYVGEKTKCTCLEAIQLAQFFLRDQHEEKSLSELICSLWIVFIYLACMDRIYVLSWTPFLP